MKKYFLLLGILFQMNVHAQMWIDQSATWHYDFFGIASAGFVRINYTGDSLIQGKNCQVLSSTGYEFIKDQFQVIHFFASFSPPNEYTYSNGDTVFYFRNNKFYILYNFGAQPGDSWEVDVDTNNTQCLNTNVKVDSVGTMQLSGNTYRWFAWSPENNSSAMVGGKVIERFGSMDGYIFPYQSGCNGIWDIPFYHLVCYEDVSINYNVALNNDCEYLLNHLGIEEQTQGNSIFIYPNPSDGPFSLFNTKQENYKLEVLNISGQMVAKFDLKKKTENLDFSNLQKGIYILKITTEGKSTFKKIVLH